MATATAKREAFQNADEVWGYKVTIAGYWVGTIYLSNREIAPFDAYCHRGGGAMQCTSLEIATQFILRCAARNVASAESQEEAA